MWAGIRGLPGSSNRVLNVIITSKIDQAFSLFLAYVEKAEKAWVRGYLGPTLILECQHPNLLIFCTHYIFLSEI